MQKEPSTSYNRASGVLAHITSLPSRYGIGDLGPSTCNFINFLESCNQTIWQILPLGPTDHAFDNSPYMTVSAFAGNPLLISPDLLFQSGLLSRRDLDTFPRQNPYSVSFTEVTKLKKDLLRKAHTIFQTAPNREFENFKQSTDWLKDYALYMALKKQTPVKAWYQWDQPIISRDKKTLSQVEHDLIEDVEYYMFEQYVFQCQWQQLRDYAAGHGIKIFGDIPIYVSLDSVDVWANQEIFQLDANTGLPTNVAGVPPDYFSKTGQKWGNPLYHWNHSSMEVRTNLDTWWIRRFHSVFQNVDIARIDHFRGFASYWSIPADNATAISGIWQMGPGKDFFDRVFNKLGELNIVAEDLGDITADVIVLRDLLNFPGMKILQFAFDGNPKNSFLPYNYDSPHCIVYTGTHDNDTTLGWFLDGRFDDTHRLKIKNCANREHLDSHAIHHDLIYLALSSIAEVSIFPLQDILGFGSDCRMNTPGTEKGNWTWRCAPEFLTEAIAEWMHKKTALFGRGRAESRL